MTKRSYSIFLFLGLIQFIPATNDASDGKRQTDLRFEPSFVELIGKLVERVYPGPPNFESIAKGDKPETQWVILLDRKVTVRASKSDPLNATSENVEEVQLVTYDVPVREACNRLLDRQVSVRGTLFSALTVHHRTRVLMSVRSIRADGK